MRVERPRLVIEDGLQRVQLVRLGIEPGVDVFGFDLDDAAVMANDGDFERRLVDDSCIMKTARAHPLVQTTDSTGMPPASATDPSGLELSLIPLLITKKVSGTISDSV